jgi:hypothetical protein
MNNNDDKLQELHNQGQEDGAQGYGNYDPPHGTLSTAASLAISTDDYERKVEENEAYTQGWRNGQDSIS